MTMLAGDGIPSLSKARRASTQNIHRQAMPRLGEPVVIGPQRFTAVKLRACQMKRVWHFEPISGHKLSSVAINGLVQFEYYETLK